MAEATSRTVLAPGTLIVLGAASPRVHARRSARLAQRPAVVIIVDPFIDRHAPPPTHLVSGSVRTTVLDGMPARDDSEATLGIWSANWLVGPREPTRALHTLFPGLRCLERRSIRTRSMSGIAEALPPSGDPVTVWVDAPGSEADILAMLQTSTFAPRVCSLSIRAGLEVYFDGGLDSMSLISHLRERGYRLAGLDDEDPDFPDLSFTRQQVSVGNEGVSGHLATTKEVVHIDLEQQIWRLTDQVEQLMSDNTLLIDQIRDRQATIDRLLDELHAERAARSDATKVP